MTKVEYQVYDKRSGVTVECYDDLEEALHYLPFINYGETDDCGLYEVTYKDISK